ncbi:undecaprenyl-diphosphate phosphatase [Komagataeibacter xylinus]|uniref:Undecaprenyl-diphosphatase n=1 Tax=Komagataeibacter xylinus TaxID=28448 RepID=A0A857FPC1_KOMXY|nr:undecaprenyl-diphosphate phosphatase [Komagataeibacter xylinus]QHC36153.1 undecaprenyl-diphosphate phosphatase [Komagataeibacter xylinus]
MTLLQAIIIAIIQGATEQFPISSLGHAAIVPAMLHWPLDLHGEMFLPLLVMLHLGTCAALLVFFWRDWVALFTGAAGRHGETCQMDSIRILALLCVATIPAVLIGGLFEHAIRNLFGTARYAAVFLTLNGVMLLAVDRMRATLRHHNDRPLAALGFGEALVIGLFQCLAFFPGLSRSGACIVGGLLRGLSHENAARFSFLMAQPVILAATVLEALKLRHAPPQPEQMHMAIIAAIVAGVVALVCTGILMRYFRDHEDWALRPFGWYCMGAGVIAFLYLSF